MTILCCVFLLSCWPRKHCFGPSEHFCVFRLRKILKKKKTRNAAHFPNFHAKILLLSESLDDDDDDDDANELSAVEWWRKGKENKNKILNCLPYRH